MGYTYRSRKDEDKPAASVAWDPGATLMST
jgi:hypothetical protein